MSTPPVLPQQRREHPEPLELSRPVPWALVLLMALMFSFGIAYIAKSEVNKASAIGDGRSLGELRAPAANLGTSSTIDAAAIYASRCAACHQAKGQGLPGVFPPLDGSEWISGSETVLIAVVLHGISGRISVKGQSYEGSMPAFKSQLSDAELAALLSHLRQQWGAQAAPIKAETVAQVRQESSGRQEPFQGDDLEQLSRRVSQSPP